MKDQIIETAGQLFALKGYEKCSINDIISAMNVSKGAFYYYFKSKEDVLDAVISHAEKLMIDKSNDIAKRVDLSPEDKLLFIFLALRSEGQESNNLLVEIHKPENVLLHQKSLVSRVESVTPILTEIVNEGIHTGIFHCPYPDEYMRIFLLSSLTLLDDSIFTFTPEEARQRFAGLISLFEQMLGVSSGSLMNKALANWTL